MNVARVAFAVSFALACSSSPSKHVVRVDVTGLSGSGLVLQNGGADDLAVTAPGFATFATALGAGASYSVAVKSQPVSPSQTCSVAAPAGTIGGADVTVEVSCVTNRYKVSGSVAQLSGTGLILRDNGGDDLAVPANATHLQFATPVASGATYAVSVFQQPVTPSQTCIVGNGAGTVGAADVTSVGVSCTTNSFPIQVSVHGLNLPGLMLGNGGDRLTPTADGVWQFVTPVQSGGTYAVSILSQPGGLTCSIQGGSGTVGNGPVQTVAVNCSVTTRLIGGTVAGLLGSGLTLLDNGGDDLSVAAGAQTFAFHTPVAQGASYAVTVSRQPSQPTQDCQVTRATGTVGANDVNSVVVTCTTRSFKIGGTVTGLAGTGLVLENDAGDDLTVTTSPFSFNTPVTSGGTYAVTVKAQPVNPAQTCSVTAGNTGTVGGADVQDVRVTCVTNTYAVGGTITGLAGTGLVLRDNGGDDTPVPAGATSFDMQSKLASGTSYAVSIFAQPTNPSQTCTVSNPTGPVQDTDVNTVGIACTVDTFRIGVTVTGLPANGNITLANNGGGELLTVGSSAETFFTAPVPSGATYDVEIQSSNNIGYTNCTAAGNKGTVGNGDVHVMVSCVPQTFYVGGDVAGRTGQGLVMEINGGEDVTVNNSHYTFPTPLPQGAAWTVTIKAQPSNPTQVCTFQNPSSGVIDGGGVNNVNVLCVTSRFQVGGSISGLAGTGLVLKDNGGDDLPVPNGVTSFTFATSLDSGATYRATVSAQPANPWQTCAFAAGTDAGTVGGQDVRSLQLSCATNTYALGGTIDGLAGSTLTLSDGAESFTVVRGSTSFQFPTKLASGTAYDVVVQHDPSTPAQTCTVDGGASGQVAGADLNNVHVTCTTRSFTVGGKVSGLTPGSSVQLLDNNGDPITVSTNGAFTFPAPLLSGTAYLVSVGAQPADAADPCTVSAGSGTVYGGDVTSVVVTCGTGGYTVGGTLSGLAQNTTVTLAQGSDTLQLAGNGAFAFNATVADGAAYDVLVTAQPTNPWQTCTAGANSGTVSGANVTNVSVSCQLNQYNVGGTVSGLNGGTLRLANGTDTIDVSANTAYHFTVASGASYAIAVAAQPAGQTCTVDATAANGTVTDADVSDVAVTCAPALHTIGGTISGLTGTGLQLLNNGGDAVSPSPGDATFSFPTPLASGASYAVTIGAQPSGQACGVSNGAGTVAQTDVNDVQVQCCASDCSVPPPAACALNGTQWVVRSYSALAQPACAGGSCQYGTSDAPCAGNYGCRGSTCATAALSFFENWAAKTLPEPGATFTEDTANHRILYFSVQPTDSVVMYMETYPPGTAKNVFVGYSLSGTVTQGNVTLPMNYVGPSGNNDLWSATLPPQPSGTNVNFYFQAKDFSSNKDFWFSNFSQNWNYGVQ